MSGLRYPKEVSTLLVDDEDVAIHRLKKALEAYPAIKVVGEAKDGRSAVEMINTLRPDLVFLDIQMPEFNGFEVLNHLTHFPLIVFVTAYEEYAIKAFEKNSLDYLLKPVEAERLAITIKRIFEKDNPEEEILLKLKQLISDGPVKDVISTMPVKVGNKIHLVHMAEICFLEAKDKYVYIHTATEEHLVDYPLTYLQDRLPAEFIRVHRGFIINKLKIKEIHKYFKGTYVLVMDNAKSTRVKSAYSYHEIIKIKLLLP
jgi:two-component system LytT family response regulator